VRQAERDELELLRHERLARFKRELWYGATEILRYRFDPEAGRGLTERLHRPVCDWLDRRRDTERVLVVARRGWHKSTIMETRQLQNIVRDPLATHLYVTGSDDLCNDIAAALGQHMRHSEDLRALDPVGINSRTGRPFRIWPGEANKKFVTLTPGHVSINLNRPYGYKSKGRTIRFRTWSSEGTGKHIDGECILDDIIGKNAVERSEVQKITRFVEHTINNIVDSRRWLKIATFWPGETVTHEWMNDPEVASIVLPGAIGESDREFVEQLERDERKVHLKPCYTFDNPTFWPTDWVDPKSGDSARRRLEKEQRESKGQFAEQIMCDPEPKSDLRWHAGCEHWTSVRRTETAPGIEGAGAIFVLSDPAPYLQGGYKGLGERKRQDGTKDYWSLAVVKLRPRGDVLDRILLDGAHSQEWGHRQGADEAVRLMKKWRTSLFFSENPDEHWPHMLEAGLRAGCSMRRGRDNGPLCFESYNRSDRKNADFFDLCDTAQRGELWICAPAPGQSRTADHTCPDEYLYGDRQHTGFLTGARKWRKIAEGRNNLRFDDDPDVVARSTDPALLSFAPRPHVQTRREPDWEDQEAADGQARRSRYCAV
jgi:hypothetical protein